MNYVLIHSAKGTTWQKKDHKYAKKIGQKYYYAKEAVKDAVTGDKYKKRIAGAEAVLRDRQYGLMARRTMYEANKRNAESFNGTPRGRKIHERNVAKKRWLGSAKDLAKQKELVQEGHEKVEKYRNEYYTKSLAGFASKGRQVIKETFGDFINAAKGR